MSLTDLTVRQKDILRTPVQLDEAGCFDQQGIAMFTQYQDAYHLLGGKHDLSSLADLDELCAEGLLEEERRIPDARYRITNLGRRAIATDFNLPTTSPASPISIGAIYGPVGAAGAVQGGNFQVVNHVHDAELKQIVNDPTLLQARVDELSTNLLNEVKSALSADAFNQYAAAVAELKQQILTRETPPSLGKRLLQTLALLGDVEGTLGLMTRVWPLVQPLLALAAMKLL